MSIYIDQKIEDRNAGAVKTLSAWHGNFPLLAVASADDDKGSIVSLYNETGAVVNSDVTPKFGGIAPPVTCMEWHSSRKILFIGYESGDLRVWNQQLDDDEDFVFTRHNQSLTVISCSENGMCLVTCDGSGTCVGWRVDVKGKLSAQFTQDLKEVITDIAFRNRCIANKEEELNRLAQAAVSGDETALNMFSGWSSGTQEESKRDGSVNDEDVHRFFVGCLNGMVCYFDENGHFENVLQMETAILRILYYEDRDMLVLVTEALVLAQYHISTDGSLTEASKVKLSGRKTKLNVQWAGNGVLSVCTGERTINFWNVNTGQNSSISLDDCTSLDGEDTVTCISFHHRKSVMSLGTNYGYVVSWKPSYKITNNLEDEMWHADKILKFQGSIRALDWSKNIDILSAMTATDIYLITEQEMCFAFRDQVSAIQLAARQVALESQALPGVTVHLLTDMTIKAVYLSSSSVALSTGKQLTFYEINFPARKTKHIGSFSLPPDCSIIALHEQSVYVINDSVIEVRTYQGTLKNSLSFMESEGKPAAIEVCYNFLVAVTSKGIAKVWDISKREAKLHFGPRMLEGATGDKEMACIKSNCKGDKLSYTLKRRTRSDYVPDPILYVLDTESNEFFQFDFTKGKEVTPVSDDTPESPVHKIDAETEKLISGRYPVNHFWISEDERLLTCEAKPMPPPLKRQKMHEASYRAIARRQSRLPDSSGFEKKQMSVVASFYVVPNMGMFLQDHYLMEQNQISLLGVFVPYHYILKEAEHLPGAVLTEPTPNAAGSQSKQNAMENYQSPIEKRVMRDFVGMEDCEKATKEALMSFSYYLTIGDMDEAFRAIRVIKTESVWSNMARMCIKTKRLDVAKICLGKMGHVRAAMALQEAENEAEHDVKVAMLAVHLNMTDEAEQLFMNCKRYDLLNKLYQDTNRWAKALEIAEKYDRIHLRNTYYNYADHLEFMGDINGAIQMYEKADVHTFEVPRMLFEKPRALEAYVLKSKNKELYCWWAQYLESIDEMESALQYYELAQDNLSLVRLYSYCNNLDKAAEIANETGDKAACFHVGRQFENQGNIKEAVHFFTRAKAFNNAIRICKEHNLEDQLMNLALMSGRDEMVDVATHYEKQEGQCDKAILLYHKAGLVTKAVELAFKSRQYDALLNIANDLPPDSSQEVLLKCAKLFLDIDKPEKAVDLLALASHQQEALRLCLENNITITEELAEKLTPPKESGSSFRAEVLEKIGDTCSKQESYHLAAKKYTQAGKRVKAMKALLKSGDTEKIIFFANVSRQREIYIMVANYLQTLDWRQDPGIMGNIVSFYTKGKCFDHLSSFYEACAQDEIDEYQNYEKAAEALTEACKCLSKAETSDSSHEQLSRKTQKLRFKTELVKQFVYIQQNYPSFPDDSVKQCRELLKRENIEEAVRRGDIYSFLVEHYCRVQNYRAAYDTVLEMKSVLPDVNLTYYIKREYLEAICRSLGIEPIIEQKSGAEDIGVEEDVMYEPDEDI